MKQLNPGPRADFLNAHPEQLAVQNATVKSIVTKIDSLSKRVKKWVEQGIDLANELVEVGLFYVELCDSLPGKKMTVDLWQQHKSLFIGKDGKQITQDQLEWAGKLARAKQDGFTEIQEVFGYRQQMLGSAGLELVGDAPGTTAHKISFYNKLFDVLDTKKLDTVLSGIENDKNYGPVESWDSERRQRVWIQTQPFFKKIHELENKLKPVEV